MQFVIIHLYLISGDQTNGRTVFINLCDVVSNLGQVCSLDVVYNNIMNE